MLDNADRGAGRRRQKTSLVLSTGKVCGWETKEKLMLTDTTKYGNCRSVSTISKWWAMHGRLAGDEQAVGGRSVGD